MTDRLSSRSSLHERLAKAISDVERATLANIDAALPVFKEALSALSEIGTIVPTDIFNAGGTAAWLHINGEKVYIAPGESFRLPAAPPQEQG